MIKKREATKLAKAELKEIAFKVLCNCGKGFRAEDFEPECPYCGRRYSLRIVCSPEELDVEIEPVRRTPLRTRIPCSTGKPSS